MSLLLHYGTRTSVARNRRYLTSRLLRSVFVLSLRKVPRKTSHLGPLTFKGSIIDLHHINYGYVR